MAKSRRKPGRPTTGMEPGEKASEYRRFTMRLPEATAARLSAIGRTVNKPAWKVIVTAVDAYLGEAEGLKPEERRAARALLRLES